MRGGKAIPSEWEHSDPGKGFGYDPKCTGKPLEGFKEAVIDCNFEGAPWPSGWSGLEEKPSLLWLDKAGDSGGLDQGYTSEGIPSWADLEYILKVKLMGFRNRLSVGGGEGESRMISPRILAGATT